MTPIALEPLLPHVCVWALVLIRLTGLFIVAPIFASVSVPVRVKVFLAVALSVCVYPMVMEPAGKHPQAAAVIQHVLTHGLPLAGLAWIVLSELLVGLIIGFGSALPIYGVQIGARMVDQQMGLGLATVYNPELGDDSGVLDQVYFILAMTLFLILGGHRVVLDVMIRTFDGVPLGGFSVNDRVMEMVLGLMGSMIDLGLRVAGPVLALVFLETVAMGFIARTVPQMNVLSIGFPLRIIVCTLLIIASINGESALLVDSMDEALRRVGEVMAPAPASPGGR